GRVESIGKTPKLFGNDGQGIRTPDVGFGENDIMSGMNLVIAQTRFPVTSPEEMKAFFHDDKNNQEIREYLASRIGNYGEGTSELADLDY
ncbi:MAG: cytochrome c peroxidase, partial [Alteromonadaceae bacterium]